jgi:Domain of unknown function (DUF4403)
MRKIAAIGLLVLLSACTDWDAKAPPVTPVGQKTVDVPDSVLNVDIAVYTAEVERQLLAKYANEPLSSGRSEEISGKLFLNEKTTVEKVVDVVVTPFKAAGCATVKVASECVKNTVESIAEDCFKKLRLDKCFKTVTKSTIVPCEKELEECWPEVKEYIESQVQLATEIHETLFPTSFWMNHKVMLRGADIEANGQNLHLSGKIDINISIDVKQGILSESVTVKGALACDMSTQIDADFSTNVTDAPSVEVKAEDFNIGIDKLCVPGAVELADLAMINPGTIIQKKLIEDTLKPIILKELNKQLNKSTADSLNFADDLDAIAQNSRKPMKLADDLWLSVNPKELSLSQFGSSGSGADNRLMLQVGLKARPTVQLGSEPPPSQGAKLPVKIAAKVPPSFTLGAGGAVNLESASTKLLKEVQALLDKEYSDIPVTVGDIDLYQSGDRLALALTFVQRSGGKEEGKLYLFARPYLDVAAKEVRLADVDLDADSKRVAVKVIAKLADGVLEDIIEDKAKFAYGGELAKLQAEVSKFESIDKNTKIFGTIDTIDPKDIWVQDQDLRLWAEAKGSVALTIAPDL